VIATVPLPLRNRLAETILRALRDPRAREEIATLADAGAVQSRWLDAADARWAPLLEARARAAITALAGWRPVGGADDLAHALAAAAALFDAGLYFEVHEILEPHWSRATGETRETLQGLIQAAVGWQHLANDNVAGARSLLQEAVMRLHGRRLGDVDLDPLARAAADAVARLPAIGAPPRFHGGAFGGDLK
jgi:DUF309 family protein family protein